MFCYADVAINIPRDNLFTYVVDDERLFPRLEVGKRVLVPFRGRQVSGYLVSWRRGREPHEKAHCLLPLAAKSVLAWQLEVLAANNVNQVTVVTGYGAELVEQEQWMIAHALKVTAVRRALLFAMRLAD